MSEALPYALAPGASLLGIMKVKTPTPPDAPKSISPETKGVQAAVAEAAARRSRARGFQSTILSQPSELKQTFGS